MADGLNQPPESYQPESYQPESYQLESYQDEIYLGGVDGATPVLPMNLAALEDLARGRMAAESFDYIRGGAGTEDTVR